MNQVRENFKYRTEWAITKFASEADFAAGNVLERVKIDGNMLLNEGITSLLTLLIGGAETAFNNANARLGVGDSAAAEAATQTDLQAATNKLYKGMDVGYPQVAAQTVTFRAQFLAAEANFAWNEFCVDNGAGAAKTLNRKVSAQGTKIAGQVWTLDVTITLA